MTKSCASVNNGEIEVPFKYTSKYKLASDKDYTLSILYCHLCHDDRWASTSNYTCGILPTGLYEFVRINQLLNNTLCAPWWQPHASTLEHVITVTSHGLRRLKETSSHTLLHLWGEPPVIDWFPQSPTPQGPIMPKAFPSHDKAMRK